MTAPEWPGDDDYILHTRAALAASPLVQEIVAEAVQEAARGRLLEKALKVAMGYLAPQQPDDSSAVDDWCLA